MMILLIIRFGNAVKPPSLVPSKFYYPIKKKMTMVQNSTTSGKALFDLSSWQSFQTLACSIWQSSMTMLGCARQHTPGPV